MLAALMAGAGFFALIVRRPRSPRRGRVEDVGEAERAREPAGAGQPRRATSPQSADHHDAPAPEKCQRTEVHHAAHEDRRWRAELAYWIVSGVTGAAAAGAAAFAGWYAKGAYEASLRAVQEARRQADTAERQLVASTRARLKLTPVTDAYVNRAKGVSVAWFSFKPTYKNFGPSPAEDISFEPHIFVFGAGPSPKQACKTGEGWTMHDPPFTDVVFPQDEGGGSWISTQVPLQRIKEEAAKILAIQPSGPVYLSIVGCLTYRSGGITDTYVTGFAGNLHPAGAQRAKPGKYIPLYDILIAGDGPVEIEIEVQTLDAWAD